MSKVNLVIYRSIRTYFSSLSC